MIQRLKISNPVAAGDLVVARDEFTGAINWRPVRDLFRRTAPSISRLTLDSPDGKRETLSVTSEHPFFVEGKGWLEVRRLQKGDRVISEKNALLAVAEITHDDRPTLVYNFEVAQDHNYFVGDEGAEAHNPFTGGPFWDSLVDKIRGTKARRAEAGCIYVPDFLHDELEKFNPRGNKHLGSFDPKTGLPIPGKGPVPGRKF